MKAVLLAWVPPAIALVLFVAASVMIAIYYGDTWAISYATPLSADLLWRHAGSLSVHTLMKAWSTGPYDLLFVVTVLAWPLLVSRGSARAQVAAGVLPLVLLFPINVVGTYMAFFEIATWPGWDGETLAEGWLLVELYGLWSLWAAAYLVLLWRRRPQNNAMNLTNREVPGLEERRPSGEPEHG